jgi:NADPH:quinone reductase-like Zn-dependent oxidoreductase
MRTSKPPWSNPSLQLNWCIRSGYHIITTWSPRNFEYVKSLGADFVVDYNSADAGAQIRAYTDNKLKYAWDTVSIAQSATICADALTTESQLDPVYGTLLPVKSPVAM